MYWPTRDSITVQPAITIVTPAERDVVEVEIKTGRTHQIRIHLSGIGHPVIGDRRYGGPTAERLMLHAWQLAQPSLGELVAPPPAAIRSTA